MMLILKVFLRLLNSFEAIFRRETSTALKRKLLLWQISRQVLVCLPFNLIFAEICFVYSGPPIVFGFHFKSAE